MSETIVMIFACLSVVAAVTSLAALLNRQKQQVQVLSPTTAQTKALDEAKAILEDAKRASRVQFVKYDHIPAGSPKFLQGMNTFAKSPYVKSWLQQHKAQCSDMAVIQLAQGDTSALHTIVAQIALIDGLAKDLSDFEAAYAQLLAREGVK